MNGGIIGNQSPSRSGLWTPFDVQADTNGVRSASVDVTNGLIHRYPLTANANDTVGSAHLTNNNNVSFSSDGASFVRTSSQYLSATLQMPSLFSLALWVSAAQPNSGEKCCILGLSEANVSNYLLLKAEPSVISIVSETAGTMATPHEHGDWNHFCLKGYLVTATTLNCTVIVDGAVIICRNFGAAKTLSSLLALGRTGGFSGDYFTGNLRDFRIYDRHLSVAECLTLYRRG